MSNAFPVPMPADPLPGRAEPLPVPERHFVNGARIVRVHDVAATRDVLAVWTATVTGC